MAEPQKLIVLMAFDRDPETGEVGNAFEPKQMQSESRAIREVERLSDHHAGVIAFSRTADPDLGEYGEAVVLAQYGEIPDLE